METKKLLLVCFVAILYLPTIHGECRDVSSECEWDDEHQYYYCIITQSGTPSSDTVRRLQLPNCITNPNVDHLHVTAVTELEAEIFWNTEYLMLSLQEVQHQPSGKYPLTITAVSYGDTYPCETLVGKVSTQLIFRSFDVQLTNTTPIANGQEVVLECIVTGLDPTEKDVEIRIINNDDGNYKMCEYDWPSTRQEGANPDDPYSISTNNGTTCQLHIPHPTLSNNGDYYCKVKVHINEPKSDCMFLKSQPMPLRLPEELSGNDKPTNLNIGGIAAGTAVGIFVGIAVGTVITVTVIVIIIKKFKYHPHNQQGQDLPQQANQDLERQNDQEQNDPDPRRQDNPDPERQNDPEQQNEQDPERLNVQDPQRQNDQVPQRCGNRDPPPQGDQRQQNLPRDQGKQKHQHRRESSVRRQQQNQSREEERSPILSPQKRKPPNYGSTKGNKSPTSSSSEPKTSEEGNESPSSNELPKSSEEESLEGGSEGSNDSHQSRGSEGSSSGDSGQPISKNFKRAKNEDIL